jgi:hypothetical protein
MSRCRSEKVLILIKGISQITNKRVEIILEDDRKIWLPIDESERFGNRVYVPKWLAKKYGFDQVPF